MNLLPPRSTRLLLRTPSIQPSRREADKLALPDIDRAARTRNPNHIDGAIAAATLRLDSGAMRRIDEIVAAEVPVGGPGPEAM